MFRVQGAGFRLEGLEFEGLGHAVRQLEHGRGEREGAAHEHLHGLQHELVDPVADPEEAREGYSDAHALRLAVPPARGGLGGTLFAVECLGCGV